MHQYKHILSNIQNNYMKNYKEKDMILVSCLFSFLNLFFLSNFIIGYSERGSIWVAQTSDRLHTLKRQYAAIKSLGVDCEILNVEKIKEKVPIIHAHKVWVNNR